MIDKPIVVEYGITVVNPTMQTRIYMPKLTLWEAIKCALSEVWYVASQAFLFALAVVAFRFALGGFG